MNTDILFADNLDDMISGSFDRYCTHALCREGEASFLMTGRMVSDEERGLRYIYS